MLGITGRKGDGWLPTKMFPEEYGAALAKIRESSVAAGRPEDAVTPGMLAYVIVGPDEEAVERVKQHPLVRLLCILLPSDDFVKLGIDPPLGSAGSGFHDFLPTRVGREEALALAEAIPPRTLDYYAFCGTRRPGRGGVRHVPRAGPAAPDPLEHHRLRRSVPGRLLVQGDERDPHAA